jgi:hypothetical protein
MEGCWAGHTDRTFSNHEAVSSIFSNFEPPAFSTRPEFLGVTFFGATFFGGTFFDVAFHHKGGQGARTKKGSSVWCIENV